MLNSRLPLIAIVLAAGLTGLAVTIPTSAGSSRLDALESLSGSAKLDMLMELVVKRQRSLRSLRADFIQLKRSELLLEPVESTGEFCYLAPDRVRWDYREPDAMVVVFADDVVTTFHPEGGRAERLKISRRERRMVKALGGTLPLDDLMAYFKISFEDTAAPEPYYLEFRPTSAAIQKKLDSLRLAVDRHLLLPTMMEYNEADGDTTRYEFHDLEIDPELSGSRFRLEFGAGVVVETIDASNAIG
jgi:outer membrane lipoprotein carrier protein